MIARRIREALRLGGQALLHPNVTPAPLREAAWAPRVAAIPAIPGNAGAQALAAAMQARHHNTAQPGWRHFLEEGQAHLAAGRLPDAKVNLEHAAFIAGDQPAVQGALAVLKIHTDARTYEVLLDRADSYEAEGHLLEAGIALRMAHDLKPSAQLLEDIERLED